MWVISKDWLTDDKGGVIELADPLDSVKLNKEEDPYKAKLGALLTAWKEVFGKRGATAKLAVTEAEKDRSSVLYETIDEIAGDTLRGLSSKSLGKFLVKNSGNPANGLKFVAVDKKNTNPVWSAHEVKK